MITNFFQIKQGSKTIIRHNSINNPFFFYKHGYVMCSKIYVCFAPDRYYYMVPKLESYNYSASKGGFYATFSATIPTYSLVGRTISEVGFAAGESQLMQVNTCQLDTIKRDEPLQITGTMVLSTSGEGFAFLGEDNPLVRMLLGVEMFVPAYLSMNFGDENTPMAAYKYTQTRLPKSINSVFYDEELVLSAQFEHDITDIVLLLNNSPVFRIFAQMSIVANQKYQTAISQGSVTVSFSDKDIKVDSLSVSNTAITGYAATRIPQELSFVADSELKLAPLSKIRRDTSRQHHAYVNGNQAAILNLNQGKVNITKYVSAKDILLCEDGAFFAIKQDNKVDFYKDGIRHCLDIKLGQKYAASAEDGQYIVGSFEGSTASFFKISKELSVTTDTFEWGCEAKDVHVFATTGRVCMCSNFAHAQAFSPQGSDTNRQAWLSQICSAAWFYEDTTPIYDSGKIVLYRSYFDQAFYYYDMSYQSVQVPGYGKIEGEFKVRNLGIRAEIGKADDITKTFLTLNQGINCVQAKDRYLYVFTASGQIKVYYINSSQLRLSHGMILSGSTVGYMVHSVTPASGDVSIKIKRS